MNAPSSKFEKNASYVNDTMDYEEEANKTLLKSIGDQIGDLNITGYEVILLFWIFSLIAEECRQVKRLLVF